MSDRFGFHAFWLGGGMVASMVSGSLAPLVATVFASLCVEIGVFWLRR